MVPGFALFELRFVEKSLIFYPGRNFTVMLSFSCWHFLFGVAEIEEGKHFTFFRESEQFINPCIVARFACSPEDSKPKAMGG